jgi:hypothetical protein
MSDVTLFPGAMFTIHSDSWMLCILMEETLASTVAMHSISEFADTQQAWFGR